MGEHEPCVGASDEWFTPPEIFAGLGLTFDLDPCQPEEGRAFLSVPCRRFMTASDDGLAQPWHGLVWLNPPFGGRNGQVPWLSKFLRHGNGIALVAARTSAGWFHDHAISAETALFPRGKTKFVRPDGTRGESPGTGIVLLGMGTVANEALSRCGLGWFIDNRRIAA
ncbi:DNA N-6-adenine-methyltransferase [Roseomonas elaeocarpi]|uniref:DNA N-6-adenine-methyltransferase n=1 Tax=Roseomonas elaeocarpi TaxID=907779 RepID=A0ABV6JUF4_9PROT